MKPLLSLTLLFALPLAPLTAQGPPTVVGTWIGDVPGARGKDGLKVELTIAKDGDDWSLSGTLYKGGQEVGTFKGTSFKTAGGGGILYFSEAVDKAPAEWNA